MSKFIYPHIAITVNDISKTKIFYKKLNFEILIEHYSKEKKRHFALISGYNFQMEVFQFTDQVKGQLVSPELKTVGLQHIALKVDAVDNVKIDLLNKGIPIFKDITESNLGVKFINVVDPNGFIIEFFQTND